MVVPLPCPVEPKAARSGLLWPRAGILRGARKRVKHEPRHPSPSCADETRKVHAPVTSWFQVSIPPLFGYSSRLGGRLWVGLSKPHISRRAQLRRLTCP